MRNEKTSIIRWIGLLSGLSWILTGCGGLSHHTSTTVVPNPTGLGLNTTGESDGLALSVFLTNLSPTTMRATSLATNSAGNVLLCLYSDTSDSGSGGTNIYSFKDVDGQTLSNAVLVNPVWPTNLNSPGSTAFVVNGGGTLYFSFSRLLYSLNDDGSENNELLGGAEVTASGLAYNPVSGHLYAGTNISPDQNISDINVSAGAYTLHAAGGGGADDVSADGTTLFYSHYPSVYAFDTTSFNQIWASTIQSGPVQRIPKGKFAGDLLGYDGSLGNLMLYDAKTGVAQIVGTGGPTTNGVGGMGIDSKNGSLFIGLGNAVLRITFS